MKRPAYGNAKAWRAAAALNLILIILQTPFAILVHGLPVLWQDYPSELRQQAKTLWTGKPGPYDGVFW